MIWSTSHHDSRGSIEGMLSFSLLLLAAWGSAMVSMVMIQSGNLERGVWSYAMARAHHHSEPDARRTFRTAFWGHQKDSLRFYAPSIESDCLLTLSLGADPSIKLPNSFRIAVLTGCNEKILGHFDSDLTGPLMRFLRDHGLNGPDGGFESTGNPRFRRDNASVSIPKTHFRDAALLKQGLYQEAMMEAGFGLLPFQLLAVPELIATAKAAGGGLVGSGATDLIGNKAGMAFEIGGDQLASFSKDALNQWIQKRTSELTQQGASNEYFKSHF